MILEVVLLPLFSAVQKNLQLPVQEPMGSLARPVTTDYAHDDTWHSQEGNDDEGSLHMASVPLV